jgi:hypothetical protein
VKPDIVSDTALVRIGGDDTFFAHLDHMGGGVFTYSTLCAMDPEYPFSSDGAEGKPLCGMCKDQAILEGWEIPDGK